ncbi:MAG TPA: AmmeMemoRadiSam system protein A [Haloplasmataceae bacterium]
MDYSLGYYLMPHPPIMIPEVGKGEERKIQNTINACKKIGQEISNLKPDTIVIITSHGPIFSDAIALCKESSIYGDLGRFNAYEVNMHFDIDLELTNKIMEFSKEEKIQTVGTTKELLEHYNRKLELDHGCIIPLYYINQYYKDYKIVHITYGFLTLLELYQFGYIIQKAINSIGRKCVIIASGDLSHRLSVDGPYSYSPKGKIFDEQILHYLENGKTIEIFNMNKKDVEEAGECGYRSIIILTGAMGEYRGTLLSYEGTFGVGYGVMSFQRLNNKNLILTIRDKLYEQLHEKIARSDHYVKLARQSIEYYFENKKLMEVPNGLPEELINLRRGVFVSLYKCGSLRGCIGTFLPTTKSIAQEIITNAIEAAFRDPRFPPLDVKELIDIDISVDVLSEPMKANKENLDPKVYGVIVSQGNKRGLLLPDLEGVNTVQEQLKIACQKAGINPNTHYDIEKFSVERHIEGERNI